MPHYMFQVAYDEGGLQALVKSPQDRIAMVTPAVKKAGGKVEVAYFSFGEYDVMLVAELPDNVAAAGLALAFGAGGSLKAVKTTPLLTAAESVEAMKKASKTGYKPPK